MDRQDNPGSPNLVHQVGGQQSAESVLKSCLTIFLLIFGGKRVPFWGCQLREPPEHPVALEMAPLITASLTAGPGGSSITSPVSPLQQGSTQISAGHADTRYGSLPSRPVAIRPRGEQAGAWWRSFSPVYNRCPQLFHSLHSPLYHSAAGDGDIKAPRATASSSIPLPGRGEESPGQH